MRIRKTRDSLPLYVLSLLIIFLFFGICAKQQALDARAVSGQAAAATESSSDDAYFVTVFDGEEKIVLRSESKTVGELLERAQVQIRDGDKVEPALTEEITEDDFKINIYRARDLVVIDGVKEVFVHTAATDPSTIAADAGVKLLAADRVELVPYDKFLETGMMTAYQVVRAKTVALNFNGSQANIRTQAKTVAEFLDEQNIDQNPEINWVSLKGDTRIKDGINLSVYFQGKQVVTVEEAIPFTEKTTMDFSLDYGTRVVTQAGVPGKKNVVYDIEMRNGQVISRQFVSEVVTQAPIEQQVTIGMKVVLPAGSHEDWMASVGISSSDYGYVNFIIEHESHWNPLSRNTRSGATGLCQALPGSKMASAGADWATNPITQLRWCNGYAVGRYGSWSAAYEFWIKHHWW